MCDGVDLLQGLGMNRDTVQSEEAALVYNGTSIHPYIDESNAASLVIDNHFAASAQMVVDLYYALGA